MGRARGSPVTEADVQRQFDLVMSLPDSATPSMWRDIAAGRPSELNAQAISLKLIDLPPIPLYLALFYGRRFYRAATKSTALFSSIRHDMLRFLGLVCPVQRLP